MKALKISTAIILTLLGFILSLVATLYHYLVYRVIDWLARKTTGKPTNFVMVKIWSMICTLFKAPFDFVLAISNGLYAKASQISTSNRK